MRHSLFSDRERFVIIGEIGRMQGLSFGEALELLDRLLGGAIISPGGRSEPVDPGHLGCLIRQVGIREEIDHQERRALMCKLAIAGMDHARVREGVSARLYRTLASFPGRLLPKKVACSSQKGGSRSFREEYSETWDELGRFVQNLTDYFTPDPTDYPASSFGVPDVSPPGGPDWELNGVQLNRALPGGEVYGDPDDWHCRPNRRKKKPIHDDDESDTLDSRFSNWFWGDYEG